MISKSNPNMIDDIVYIKTRDFYKCTMNDTLFLTNWNVDFDKVWLKVMDIDRIEIRERGD